VNRSADGNRPYGGNSFHVGERSYNIGHNAYQPAYSRHRAYHGYWNGNWGMGAGIGGNYGWGGGYGGYGWSPLGWGLGAWGLGALDYNSGYLSYSNPYYDNSAAYGNYNYTQPIPVAYDAPAAAVADGANPADAVLNEAVAAFKQNDYAAALNIANKGITQFPDDSVLHEFVALTLFAQGKYKPAASVIHSILAVGPGWDWATLSSMYPSVSVYTAQLRKLESFVRANPQDGAARFLLAYQYLSTANVDAAERQLAQVVKLVPNDRVAADLLKMASASEDGHMAKTVVAAKPVPQPVGESKPAVASLDPATLVGTWKAARDDGSMFELTLGKNSTFDWKFTPNKQPVQEFGGTYTVEKNVLALQRKNGGSLIAEVKPGDGRNFNFKLLGGPSDDPGLAFSR